MTKNLSRREFLASIGVTAGALGLAQLADLGKSVQARTNVLARGREKDLYPILEDGKYIKKDFSHLTRNKKLVFSPEIIQNHIGLYNGYVDNVNKAEGMMAKGEVDDYSLKHLAFSLNGMALHDIYFSNMTTDTTKRSGSLTKAIEETFGSVDAYMKNLTTIATKVEGWSITGLNLLNGKIFNYGEDTHSGNFPNFVVPILALDVYEHAYVADFAKEGKTRYIDVFTKTIDWDLVSRRFDAAKNLV